MRRHFEIDSKGEKRSWLKWKSGPAHPKSVVITDFGTALSIKDNEESKTGFGSVGWAPPEQWLHRCML